MQKDIFLAHNSNKPFQVLPSLEDFNLTAKLFYNTLMLLNNFTCKIQPMPK